MTATARSMVQRSPLLLDRFCLWHSPEREDEAADARRLGGLRRRREKAVSGAYDVAGLDSIQSIRRILEIATIDTLGLENSVVRSRTLISAAVAAAKLLETGELEARLAVLELALGSARGTRASDLSDDGLLGG